MGMEGIYTYYVSLLPGISLYIYLSLANRKNTNGYSSGTFTRIMLLSKPVYQTQFILIFYSVSQVIIEKFQVDGNKLPINANQAMNRVKEQTQMTPTRTIDPFTADEVRQLKEANVPRRAIIEQLQIPPRDVPLYFPIDADKVVRDYTAEPLLSIADICKAHDLSIADLYAILHERSVTLRRHVAPAAGPAAVVTRGRPRVVQAQIDHALDLYRSGAPMWKITRDTGLATPTFYAALRAAGLPLRSSQGS
jgi:hypothetical protein